MKRLILILPLLLAGCISHTSNYQGAQFVNSKPAPIKDVVVSRTNDTVTITIKY